MAEMCEIMTMEDTSRVTLLFGTLIPASVQWHVIAAHVGNNGRPDLSGCYLIHPVLCRHGLSTTTSD